MIAGDLELFGGDISVAHHRDIPDAHINPIIDGRPFDVDVTYLNETAQTHASARKSVLSQLKDREKIKIARYQRHSTESGYRLVPIVLTTLGGHGPEAAQHAQRLALRIVDDVNPYAAYLRRATYNPIMARAACLSVNALGSIMKEWLWAVREAMAGREWRRGRTGRRTRLSGLWQD